MQLLCVSNFWTATCIAVLLLKTNDNECPSEKWILLGRAAAARSAELLRLGLLMALTMTLHNMPEGFAVHPAPFHFLYCALSEAENAVLACDGT